MSQERRVPTLNTVETKDDKRITETTHLSVASSGDANTTNTRVWNTSVYTDTSTSTPITGFDGAVKRLCDFLIGGIALIILMPLFALVSILIKLESTGPALFQQQRRGQNQQVIKVYKFRTMYEDYSTPVPTTTSFVQTQKNDPRVTRFGAFLRKTSVDELPQLFNILLGSMSMVGPRPHPIPLDDKYKHIVPALNSRYIVKPGLTGWAQINGFRGETARIEDMVGRVEHDRFYIKNWTLWLDIKIIAITAVKGWTHNNAY